MDKDLVDQVVEVANRVVASGAISANGHGNVSLRVPGAQEMYFTAGPSLRNHAARFSAPAAAGNWLTRRDRCSSGRGGGSRPGRTRR